MRTFSQRLVISVGGCLLALSATAAPSVAATTVATPSSDLLEAVSAASPATLAQTAESDLGSGELVSETATANAGISTTSDPTISVETPVKNADSLGVGNVPTRTLTITPLDASEEATAVDGVVVRSGKDQDSDFVVQPTGIGVRIYTVIQSEEAPTSYDFKMDTAVPVTAIPFSDGGYSFVDASGSAITAVEAPWAKDAAGHDVKTWYTYANNVLTQHIDTSAAGITFPVVADPAWGYSFDYNMINPGGASYGLKASASKVMTELRRCFNCSFPIGNAPRSFPTLNGRIDLNASPFSFINVPAPVVTNYIQSDGWGFVAQAGHFDGAGSWVHFRWYNDSSGLLHLQVSAYVVTDRGSAANEGNKTIANGQWGKFARQAGCNTDKYQYAGNHGC